MNVFDLIIKEDLATYFSEKLRELFVGNKCDVVNNRFSRINNLTGKHWINDIKITFKEEEIREDNGGYFLDTYEIHIQVETLKNKRKSWIRFYI